LGLNALEYLQIFTVVLDNCRKYPILIRRYVSYSLCPGKIVPRIPRVLVAASGHAWRMSALKKADARGGLDSRKEEAEIDKTVIRKGGLIFRF
jgi:hypothetical protein